MYEYEVHCFIRQGYFGMSTDEWDACEEPVFSEEVREQFNELVLSIGRRPGIGVNGVWDDICNLLTFSSNTKPRLRDAVLDFIQKTTELGIKITSVRLRKTKHNGG